MIEAKWMIKRLLKVCLATAALLAVLYMGVFLLLYWEGTQLLAQSTASSRRTLANEAFAQALVLAREIDNSASYSSNDFLAEKEREVQEGLFEYRWKSCQRRVEVIVIVQYLPHHQVESSPVIQTLTGGC